MHLAARRALLIGTLGVALVGCTRQASRETGAAAPSSAAPEIELVRSKATAAPPIEDEAAEAAPLSDDWAEAVRMERWGEASRIFESLPKEKLEEPEVRLVRARVAWKRGDAEGAAKLLKGLEEELPEVAETISRWRLEAESVAGPHAEAAKSLEKLGTLKALAQAAAAYERAELFEEAKKAADRAIARGKGDEDEILARKVRARVEEAMGNAEKAADDARWLAIQAPGDEGSSLKWLERLEAERPLTVRERLERAQNFAKKGRVDEALAELDRVASMEGAPQKEELAYTRAMILYRARRYKEAAEAFEGAKRAGARQAEASFLGARALSRADFDDEAKKQYRDVIKRFPRSAQADEASYLIARLGYLHGKWKTAIQGFDDYFRKYPRGRFRTAARYERAVSLLAAKRYRQAEKELGQLARAQKGHEGARLRALQAKAKAGAGDRKGAILLFTEVANEQPLMFAGLVARANLAAMNAEVPELIGAAIEEEAEDIEIEIPEVAKLYQSLGLDGEAEAWLRANEDKIAAGPGRGQRLCETYGELSRASRRYRIGIAFVPQRVLMRAPSEKTQWAWECVYPRPYASMVDEVEEREGLPRGLVHAVMRVESAFDPEAISRARAMGLLQLLPTTAKKLAEENDLSYEPSELTSPPVNIDLGGRYLSKMRKTFRGSTLLAAAAYNAGPFAASRWLERSEGLDLDVFVARIPYRETRNYVQTVTSNHARYAFLKGGKESVPPLDLKLPEPIKLGEGHY